MVFVLTLQAMNSKAALPLAAPEADVPCGYPSPDVGLPPAVETCDRVASPLGTAPAWKSIHMDTTARPSLPDDIADTFKPGHTDNSCENTSLAQDSCSLGATGELLPPRNALDPAWLQSARQHERQQGAPAHNAFSLSATGELAIFPGISPQQNMECKHSDNFLQSRAYASSGE